MPNVTTHPSYDAFADRFSGALLGAHDPRYDEARELFNSMIETRPAVIAQCTSADDVAAAIAFAGDAGLEIAVRAGGHSVAGTSSVEGGIVIDVRPLDSIEIDPKTKRGRVGGGVTWATVRPRRAGTRTRDRRRPRVDDRRRRTDARRWLGLARTPVRAHVRQPVSVDLVLADGEQVTASKDSHPDLFWALHGGGGNFGVATSFEFQLHDVGPIVHAGLIAVGARVGRRSAARRTAPSPREPPRSSATAAAFVTGPPEPFVPEHLQGQPVFGIMWCCFGPASEGDMLIAPLRALGPDFDLVGPMPYADFQCMLDDPPGKRNYWSAEYLAGFDDDAIAAFVKSSSEMPVGYSQNLMVPWGGAVARVTEADTPMTNREAAWVFHPFGVWEGAEHDAEHIAWAKDALATMRKYATGGIYLNFIGDEGQDRVRAAYGEQNYARLARDQAPVRPRQRLPPQPEHQARLNRDSCYWWRPAT